MIVHHGEVDLLMHQVCKLNASSEHADSAQDGAFWASASGKRCTGFNLWILWAAELRHHATHFKRRARTCSECKRRAEMTWLRLAQLGGLLLDTNTDR